jgi:hypothetical protein
VQLAESEAALAQVPVTAGRIGVISTHTWSVGGARPSRRGDRRAHDLGIPADYLLRQAFFGGLSGCPCNLW